MQGWIFIGQYLNIKNYANNDTFYLEAHSWQRIPLFYIITSSSAAKVLSRDQYPGTEVEGKLLSGDYMSTVSFLRLW